MLQVLMPGLGHLYVGCPLRALASLAAVLAATILFAFALLMPLEPWNFFVSFPLALAVVVTIVVDAIRCARRAPAAYRLRWYNRWYLYPLILLVFGASLEPAAVPLRTHLIQSFKFPSGSMSPTVLTGDHFYVDKRAFPDELPRRGDLVIFPFPEDRSKLFLKRIVGLPGEEIEIQGRKVEIDGRALDEPYAHFTDADPGKAVARQMDKTLIPEGHFFLMGDNRDRSYDSRFFGAIPRNDLLGKATIIYFSWNDAEGSVRWSRIGTSLRSR